MGMKRIVAIAAAVASLLACMPAQAYIGEGVQGRPHGGARAASRYDLYRHGFGYHRHSRHWYRRHYGH